ncbi:uncharacterized protein Triagg1_5681 [Trichoderma aggressivum f. europaeum]|uniref:Uncharacterized protein n=1 Tax=Trichoderma aggressivum f. europaeum TaxID=173218 RepID=A0AAE1M4T5_9HYPO|nr:hypothetical protein Triagg1_5681 [Trichoderma aggressivum f. europaeum]
MPGIQESFAEYLKNNPNKKRIPAIEKRNLVRWLSDPNAKPTCQKDYSRRNYAHKTYRWDATRQKLLAKARNGKESDRIVITVEEILRTVEAVHIKDHLGWDATWRRVSKKYCGIVRQDVIWLIVRCGMCKVDPRKKSRGSHANQAQAQATTTTTTTTTTTAPPVLPPTITPPADGLEYNSNNDATLQAQSYQDIFQDVTVDAYQNPYLGVFPDDYPDIFQDGLMDIYPEIPEVCPENFPDVSQSGFQDPFLQDYQDGGWQGDLVNIDPSLLMLDQTLFPNYGQGESSGTNSYTYGDGNDPGQ